MPKSDAKQTRYTAIQNSYTDTCRQYREKYVKHLQTYDQLISQLGDSVPKKWRSREQFTITEDTLDSEVRTQSYQLLRCLRELHSLVQPQASMIASPTL